ncbi:MAG: DUF111 family protein [Firmicutes bacterium]|nr:DUF111 family protein [Bacillota bacterium]
MSRLHVEIMSALDWSQWVAAFDGMPAQPASPAVIEWRVEEISRRARQAGITYPSTEQLMNLVLAIGAREMTVGPIPLHPLSEYCQWPWIRDFKVVLDSTQGVDPRVLIFLTVMARSSDHPRGRIAEVRDWRLPGGLMGIRLVFWQDEPKAVPAVLLAANIDDMTPEFLGYLVHALLNAGARDAWISPVVMKKSRPAHTVFALVEPAKEDAVLRVFWQDSSTLGVRRFTLDTYMLDREVTTVMTPFGPVRVKTGWFDGSVRSVHPEYEDVAHLARTHRVSLMAVYASAIQAYQHAVGEMAEDREGSP